MLPCYQHLVKETGQRRADTSDFVMIHADLSSVTEKAVVERLNDYTIILATTRLLLGVNIAGVDMVIFTQPYGEIEAMLQGGGRGGRKRGDGLRNTCQVYQLVNGEDMGLQMSMEMKSMLSGRKSECTRDFLKEYFGGESEAQSERGLHCCQFHDNIVFSKSG